MIKNFTLSYIILTAKSSFKSSLQWKFKSHHISTFIKDFIFLIEKEGYIPKNDYFCR